MRGGWWIYMHAPIHPGTIMAWTGSPDSLPAGWIRLDPDKPLGTLRCWWYPDLWDLNQARRAEVEHEDQWTIERDDGCDLMRVHPVRLHTSMDLRRLTLPAPGKVRGHECVWIMRVGKPRLPLGLLRPTRVYRWVRWHLSPVELHAKWLRFKVKRRVRRAFDVPYSMLRNGPSVAQWRQGGWRPIGWVDETRGVITTECETDETEQTDD